LDGVLDFCEPVETTEGGEECLVFFLSLEGFIVDQVGRHTEESSCGHRQDAGGGVDGAKMRSSVVGHPEGDGEECSVSQPEGPARQIGDGRILGFGHEAVIISWKGGLDQSKGAEKHRKTGPRGVRCVPSELTHMRHVDSFRMCDG